MPFVSGSLATFGVFSLSPYMPSLQFIPSSPGMTPDGKLRSARPVDAVINDDQTFSVYLVSTYSVRPILFYTPVVTYQDPGGNYVSKDIFPWQLTVPNTDSVITDLLGIPLNYGDVWVSPGGVEPAGSKSGDLIYDPISDDLSMVN